MIPLELALRNFMSYGEDVPPLSLEGVHLACLSGDNGHGKSALLDALTWALWGRARARDDELVHIGKTDMWVQLDFELAGERYRVLRSRTLKGRTGQSALELQVLADDVYRPLTGGSIRETERTIQEKLHLDYETFVNSAYLRQGKADEFTVKRPGERKEVLASILGLDVYDQLAERARAKARECEQLRRGLQEDIEDIDRELARRPEYQQELKELTQRVSCLEQRLKSLDGDLESLRRRRQELEEKAKELTSLEARRQQLQVEQRTVDQAIAEHQRRVDEHQALLAQRSEIEEGHQRWLMARAQVEDWNNRLGRLLPLRQQASELERATAVEQGRLATEQRALRQTIDNAQAKIEATGRLREELQLVAERLMEMDRLEAQREDHRRLLGTCRTEIELLRTENERVRAEGEALKEKLALLEGAGAICPLCGTELGEEGRERIETQLTGERHRLANQYRQNQQRGRELDARAASTQSELADLERALVDRPRLQGREGELRRGLQEVEEARMVQRETEVRLRQVEARLAGQHYATEEQRELHRMQARIAALGYVPEAHEEARQAAAGLARFEQSMKQLELAERLLGGEQETLTRYRQDGERLGRERAELETAIEGLRQELAAQPQLSRQIAELESRRQESHQQWTEAMDARAVARQRIEACSQLEQQRADKLAQQTQAAYEKTVYEELAYAYGKNGIQAMLIDSVLPELEEEANTLLARMTEGRMTVRFQTQRAAKTHDQPIETLDIEIADEVGTRRYETFSGGEAFRVNFAIRVALSKLLARRAGARLQTLILDEGFGTQDTVGRERLVEAINSISPDFEKILVITHIDELKDAFPVRIEVTKTAEGSQITVYP